MKDGKAFSTRVNDVMTIPWEHVKEQPKIFSNHKILKYFQLFLHPYSQATIITR